MNDLIKTTKFKILPIDFKLLIHFIKIKKKLKFPYIRKLKRERKSGKVHDGLSFLIH